MSVQNCKLLESEGGKAAFQKSSQTKHTSEVESKHTSEVE